MSGWLLIIFLLLLGGLISTLGDLLGSKIGKARFSVLKLRPKKTAVLITILTGSLISASSLSLMILVNRQLRIGLFRLGDLQKKLQESKQILIPLKEESQRLENKIKSKLRVINISSRAAFRGEEEDFISYACSKGGLISLTKTLARSFGKKDNVIPFSIAPGFVNTEMAKSFIEQHGEGLASKGIVLDKLTEPKDIAPLVNFIVSGKMDHAVGSTIDINAGSYLR